MGDLLWKVIMALHRVSLFKYTNRSNQSSVSHKGCSVLELGWARTNFFKNGSHWNKLYLRIFFGKLNFQNHNVLNIIFTFCKVFVLLYLGLSTFSNEGVIALPFPPKRAEGALHPAHSALKSRKFVQVTNFVMNGDRTFLKQG